MSLSLSLFFYFVSIFIDSTEHTFALQTSDLMFVAFDSNSHSQQS